MRQASGTIKIGSSMVREAEVGGGSSAHHSKMLCAEVTGNYIKAT